MPELEIRHLRMLCAIADTSSLTQAATRLGLSQPALTAQLQRIERMVGAEVFDRARSDARITAYGRMLVDAARGVLAGVDHLQAITRNTTEPAGTVLRVGGVQGRLNTGWIRLLEERLPALEVRGRIGLSAPTLVDMVAQGQLDVVNVFEHPGYELRWPEGLVCRVLVPSEPTMVALGAAHPLAGRDELELADLADDEWILCTPDEEGSQAAFLAACGAAGFMPRVRHYADDPVSRRHFVQTGRCIAPCRATSRETDGIVIRMLAGDPVPIRRYVAWREGTVGHHAEVLFDSAARAYLGLVDNNPCFARWFAEHPETHPPTAEGAAFPPPPPNPCADQAVLRVSP
ncbi:LysR family transcriptional regulator [Streptoalloteichus hindustanus]|uniref:DNA-binding transcriptional regulator, LysR family n=1 Tax=Streptoalloteichus hindustanus TaxID=2017 RepID=A0A1M5JDW6_STRHI|nr:LysR family transcriptional regulator [Streptoalloteichus hindustanus]SHG38555.1 DNA-binding transcriptional regulator, LysR family [Streptoalloteichus hindustanus]